MITKSAVSKTNCTLNGHFTGSARAAWRHILSHPGRPGQVKVLLPAYIGFTEREGSGVFDPVLQTQADYRFYKVKPNLSVDLADFEQQLQGGIDVVLVIHYFGFCRSDLTAIKHLCTRAGAILVEDCAHAFHLESSTPALGQLGDFSFYSLHKYIATESGGFLKINNSSLKVPPPTADSAAAADVILQYALTDFKAIKDIRRRNYQIYASQLASLADIEIMFTLAEDEIPQTFAIRVKHTRREPLYFHLMDLGMPTTALYYRMIDQISAAEHPESHAIASEILNLPVHQDTTGEDAERLCAAIVDYFAQTQKP